MDIKADNVTVTYMADTPFEKTALRSINLTMKSNTYQVFIGKTGSGKSTFIQLLNGLITPSEGRVMVGDWTVENRTKQKVLYQLRKEVGMVFQFPETQLFHDTVLEDVAYGPTNLGFSNVEAERQAKASLSLVGIDASLYKRSPFELSGGQMRRVAIAGVLAMEPTVLMLDEPTAGLDPVGQKEIMALFQRWYKEKEGRSIILVTHQMEDAALYGDEVHVMHDGEVKLSGSPTDVFSQEEKLEKCGLRAPETVRLLLQLQKISGQTMKTDQFTAQDTLGEIVSFLRKDIENNV